MSYGDRAWRPSLRDTRMLTWIISQLAGAAVECTNGPIMLLQSPVSPFREAVGSNRGDGSGELVRPAEGPSLRMSISVDPAQPRRLLMFEERVHSFATENGLGLRIADRRANRIRGEWFKVNDFDGDLFERQRDELFRGVPEDSPTTAFVLTIVGPARVGSTLAVVRALDATTSGSSHTRANHWPRCPSRTSSFPSRPSGRSEPRARHRLLIPSSPACDDSLVTAVSPHVARQRVYIR